MFNYKTWRLWSPYDPALPFNPAEPDSVSVIDENGNSITPDALKKNMTIPPEEPANDLEKTLDNMNGASPAHEINSSSGLIHQLTRMEGSRGSGGEFVVNFTVDSEDNITCDKTIEEIYSASNHGLMVFGRVNHDYSDPDFGESRGINNLFLSYCYRQTNTKIGGHLYVVRFVSIFEIDCITVISGEWDGADPEYDVWISNEFNIQEA